MEREAMVEVMCAAAREAGRRMMEIYERGFQKHAKADGTPVTEADLAAEAVILERLAVFRDIPVVSEENAASHAIAPPERFFLVDPLDGTKEFVNRNGEFTVNIALIEHGVPTLGVVLAPAKDALYWVSEAGGAFEERDGTRRAIAARTPPAEGLTAAVSRSHLDPDTTRYLEGFRIAHEVSAGSSLKFCLIARGDADIYPRFGRTMEWDTAAGDAVLRAAGGRMLTPDGEVFRYGKEGFRNGFYIAFGRPA
ncbi:MAG: 3'(2'),5'-bisphosphate nucleotidase CysQ [Hyphomicrobiaceae bacterium]